MSKSIICLKILLASTVIYNVLGLSLQSDGGAMKDATKVSSGKKKTTSVDAFYFSLYITQAQSIPTDFIRTKSTISDDEAVSCDEGREQKEVDEQHRRATCQELERSVDESMKNWFEDMMPLRKKTCWFSSTRALTSEYRELKNVGFIPLGPLSTATRP